LLIVRKGALTGSYRADIQNDFLPGGALAVQDGDQILPVVYDLVDKAGWDVICASLVRLSPKPFAFNA
jgi:nicotinamidase-related amidase